MVFKSLSSLSENLLSWSAEVPLKNPSARVSDGALGCDSILTSIRHGVPLQLGVMCGGGRTNSRRTSA